MELSTLIMKYNLIAYIFKTISVTSLAMSEAKVTVNNSEIE